MAYLGVTMTKPPTMKPLTTAIRELMEEADMTETELMAAAGLSPSTINRYIRGSRGRRMNSQAVPTVRKIAAALGVEPDHFVEFRMHRIEQAMKTHRELVDAFYDVLVAQEAKLAKGTDEAGGSR